MQTGLIYCKVGDFTQAAAHLAAGVAVESGCVAFVAGCPAFAPYRDHPALAGVFTVP